MNSALQCLGNTKPLVEYFIGKEGEGNLNNTCTHTLMYMYMYTDVHVHVHTCNTKTVEGGREK